MKQILKWIFYWYRSWTNARNFGNAKKRALAMHKQTGRRYYVFGGDKLGYFVMSKAMFRSYNRITKGKKLSAINAMQECLFYTPEKKLTEQ